MTALDDLFRSWRRSVITVTEAAAGKIGDPPSEEGSTDSGLRVFVQGAAWASSTPY